MWVDPTGSGTKWHRYSQRNVTSWGADNKISQRPRDQQVEFRNDCIGANWLYNEIAEIYPPS
ncbi:MAG: hypothetical protein WBQ25_19650 [Nitrososphaeraceae archaeon]